MPALSLARLRSPLPLVRNERSGCTPCALHAGAGVLAQLVHACSSHAAGVTAVSSLPRPIGEAGCTPPTRSPCTPLGSAHLRDDGDADALALAYAQAFMSAHMSRPMPTQPKSMVPQQGCAVV